MRKLLKIQEWKSKFLLQEGPPKGSLTAQIPFLAWDDFPKGGRQGRVLSPCAPSGSAHVSDVLPTMYMIVKEGITKMVISHVTTLTVLTAVFIYKFSWCEII